YSGEQTVTLDVTSFISSAVAAGDAFAGFNFQFAVPSSITLNGPYVAFRSLEFPPAASLRVNESQDECPNSDLSPTVVIDGCNSGVTNTLFATGRTISDLITECAIGASNHGKFVSCVSSLTNDLKKAGTITGAQKGAIQSCAAQANLP